MKDRIIETTRIFLQPNKTNIVKVSLILLIIVKKRNLPTLRIIILIKGLMRTNSNIDQEMKDKIIGIAVINQVIKTFIILLTNTKAIGLIIMAGIKETLKGLIMKVFQKQHSKPIL